MSEKLTNLEQRALEIYERCAAELLGRCVADQNVAESLASLTMEMREGGIYELASFSFLLAEGFEEFRNEREKEENLTEAK